MIARMSLRWRVTVAFAAMGFLMSLGFAAATTFIAEDYEHILIDALLRPQGANYVERLAQDPSAPLPHTDGFAVYREADAPSEFQGLSPGIHEPDVPGDEGIHVGVFGERDERLVFIIGLGGIEALERYLAQIMLGIVIVGGVASGWLGWLCAGRAVSPVRRLAEVVESLPVHPVVTRLAAEFGPDEVGRLAGAIDGYQQRLSEAEAADQAFHANASHELRTPITVVQGAIEVMRDDAVVAERQGNRLDRADRAINELALLLEASLLGGRALPAEVASLPLDALVRDSLERVSRLHPAGSQRLRLRVEQPREVLAPRRWADCVINVLLQRVLSRAPGIEWDVVINAQGLTLMEREHEAGSAGPVDRSDIGLGLMFVERLSWQLGWRLVQSKDARGSLRVDLHVVA